MVRELLLGDNPFIGVSHLAHEKSRETLKELTVRRKMDVVEAAVDAGATGFTFSTHQANLELLRYIRYQRPDILDKLNYYVLVPYATGYVREATKTGFPGLVKRVLLTGLRPGTIASAIPPTPSSFIRLLIEVELREYMRVLSQENIRAILLHEVLTELITAFDLARVVKSLSSYYKKRGLGFGLETRNVGCVARFIEENDLEVEYVMTPLNPLGYQMAPNRELAENAVVALSRVGVKVIGINVLASGVLTPEDSRKYISGLKDSVYAIAFGTSSPQRARETVEKLRTLLQ